jgi:23S rRNA pseudoU1915 N3-methylase RlmH
MGNQMSLLGQHMDITSFVGFEELQDIVLRPSKKMTLINTLTRDNQTCLIQTTLSVEQEEKEINQLLRQKDKDKMVIVYGKNYHDERLVKKVNQLANLGLKNVKVYYGGLFEWLCLQEIYGAELFPTTSQETDLLKYK